MNKALIFNTKNYQYKVKIKYYIILYNAVKRILHIMPKKSYISFKDR